MYWRSLMLLITLVMSLFIGILPTYAQCDPADPLCVPAETPPEVVATETPVEEVAPVEPIATGEEPLAAEQVVITETPPAEIPATEEPVTAEAEASTEETPTEIAIIEEAPPATMSANGEVVATESTADEASTGSCDFIAPYPQYPTYGYTECNGVITNNGESSEHTYEHGMINNGQILATDNGGGDAVHVYYDEDLHNHPEGPGVVSITNNAGAVIASQSGDGIEVSNWFYLNNSGTISGADHGLESDSGYVQMRNQAGGVIYGGNDAVAITSGYTELYNNPGAMIESATGDGIDLNGRDTSAANNGTIISHQGSGIEAGQGANLYNYTESDDPSQVATIDAYCNAMRVTEGYGYINNNGILISEHCSAIVGGDRTYVTNQGGYNLESPAIIRSEESMGVEVGSGSPVFNYENAEIHANCHGVRGRYTGELADNTIGGSSLGVVNRGLIQSANCDGVHGEETVYVRTEAGSIIGGEGGDGIDMDHGQVDIWENGNIIGGDDGIEIDGGISGTTTVTNEGTITGEHIGVNAHVDGNADSQTVINEGAITGESGTAVHLGDGNDFFEAIFGSVVDGIVNGGGDSDTFRIRYDEAGANEEERSQAARATRSASAQNCPCTVSFSMMGISFNYTYTNFERVEIYVNGSRTPQTVNESQSSNTMVAAPQAAMSVAAPVVATETTVVEAAPAPIVIAAEPAPMESTVASQVIEAAPVTVSEVASVEVVAFAAAAPSLDRVVSDVVVTLDFDFSVAWGF